VRAPRSPTTSRHAASSSGCSSWLGEAEPLLRRALAIAEASLGSDHPKVALGLNNLARLLQDTNRFAEAEPLMRRALVIGEAGLGHEHPHTLTIRGNLDGLIAIARASTGNQPNTKKRGFRNIFRILSRLFG
jgi:hypothetical protein